MKRKINRIIFITRDYFPISNGTIIAIDNILTKLSKTHEIIIISQKQKKEDPFLEKINGYCSIKISNKFDKIYFYLHEYYLKSHMKKNLIFIFITQLLKNFNKLYRKVFKNKMILFNWDKQGSKHLLKLDLFLKNDVIITVGAPFENLDLVSIIKSEINIESIVILFDLYTKNPTYLLTDRNKNEISKRMNLEKHWYKINDWVITLPEYESVLDEDLKKEYKSKIKYFPLPSLNFRKNGGLKIELQKENKINLVYAGLFYEDIRNPKTMFKLFSHLFMINSNLHFHILGHGCEFLVEQFVSRYPNNVTFYGRRSMLESISASEQADVLINLENSNNTQIPSKIYELISFGKPIVNFYHGDNENCKKILNNYPLSVSYNLDDFLIRDDYKEILEFIQKTLGCIVSKSLILEKYYQNTPVFFTKRLINLLESEK